MGVFNDSFIRRGLISFDECRKIGLFFLEWMTTRTFIQNSAKVMDGHFVFHQPTER